MKFDLFQKQVEILQTLDDKDSQYKTMLSNKLQMAESSGLVPVYSNELLDNLIVNQPPVDYSVFMIQMNIRWYSYRMGSHVLQVTTGGVIDRIKHPRIHLQALLGLMVVNRTLFL